ncbi:substrate-binding periplasmic protein [Ferrovibrio sp.]|uniref:substrate-binding periplasmic protein n=1 Tax=Ferrovibrio sp. TaxID=1917215 RepID=UPI0035129747
MHRRSSPNSGPRFAALSRPARRLRAAACGLATLLVLLPPASHAADTPLRFCFTRWAPYTFLQDGEPQGLSVGILREAARRAGFAAQFAELPWKRCLTGVAGGMYDAAMDGAPREEFVSGRHSYVTSFYSFWVLAEDARLGPSDPAAFAGRKVSLVHGWQYPLDETAAAQPDYVRLDSEAGQIRSLVAGRQAAAYGDNITLRWTAIRLGLEDAVRPLLPAHGMAALYPLFAPAQLEAARKVDAAIGSMLADGAVDRIYRQHIGVGLSELKARSRPPRAARPGN